PLVARGAGTGLAGEALGAGLIVDLSVHFRRILDVSHDTVRVQPGGTLREVEATLTKQGRRFVPTPSSIEATVGGVRATNASGPRALRYGPTRDHVESFRVVLDTGDAVSVGARIPRWPVADQPHGRFDDIISSAVTLLEQNAALLQASRPRVPFDR